MVNRRSIVYCALVLSGAVAALTALTARGCGADPCHDIPDPPDGGAPAAVCDGTRQIALLDPNKEKCSPVAGWDAKPVFDPGLTGDLARYCAYRWVDRKAPVDLSKLPARHAEDCTLIAPQAPLGPGAFQAWARDAFLTNINQPPAPTGVGVRVAVVVLDTAPDWDITTAVQPIRQGKNRHADTLAHLIEHIACGSPLPGGCAVLVRTKLVMPVDARTHVEDPQTGGDLGLLSHVTAALNDELARWRAEVAAFAAGGSTVDPMKVPARLVFNMSFGFNDVPGKNRDCTDPSNSLGGRMLHEAMELAACHGALLVAAAGNNEGGPHPTDGLLCPAAWSTPDPAPDAARCAALMGKAEFSKLQANYTALMGKKGVQKPTLLDPLDLRGSKSKLVWAIGAVDHTGLPITVSRPHACPNFVALGVGADDWDDGSPDPPPPLFGTSVSTAVASAVFAATWAGPNGSGAPLMLLSPSSVVVATASSPCTTYRSRGGCAEYAVCDAEQVPWLGRSMNVIPRQNPPVTADALTAMGASNSSLFGHSPEIPKAGDCPEKAPYCQRVSAAATSGVWPAPVVPACATMGCTVGPTPPPSAKSSVVTTSSAPGWTLFVDPNPDVNLYQDLAVLAVEDEHGDVLSTTTIRDFKAGGTRTIGIHWSPPASSTSSQFRAWLSGYDAITGSSVTQQIFVR